MSACRCALTGGPDASEICDGPFRADPDRFGGQPWCANRLVAPSDPDDPYCTHDAACHQAREEGPDAHR